MPGADLFRGPMLFQRHSTPLVHALDLLYQKVHYKGCSSVVMISNKMMNHVTKQKKGLLK